LSATADAQHTDVAVQIGFAARFDLDELEAETIRFFVDDEATLGDPFAEDAHLRTIHTKALQELGFFLVPASRTWDRWISFSSELFRRVVATRGDMPAQAVRAERQRLWAPPEEARLENQPGLSEIVVAANDELRSLMASVPKLQLRLTATDSDSVLESVMPHFVQGTGPTLPSQRQGTGLVSLQSLLLLMQFGKARAETGQSFMLAVEEPELHIQPSQQKRLVNRLNALCDQTIVTTHSPIVAALFPAPNTLFIETREGVLKAKTACGLRGADIRPDWHSAVQVFPNRKTGWSATAGRAHEVATQARRSRCRPAWSRVPSAVRSDQASNSDNQSFKDQVLD
jgi:putative ATP-dependent endonuclease of OLD family